MNIVPPNYIYSKKLKESAEINKVKILAWDYGILKSQLKDSAVFIKKIK